MWMMPGMLDAKMQAAVAANPTEFFTDGLSVYYSPTGPFQNPQLNVRELELIVNAIFSAITDALADGGRVELRGFGAFTAKRRQARSGRNPRTGESVAVDEKIVPFFKAGKELRERVNNGKPGRVPGGSRAREAGR